MSDKGQAEAVLACLGADPARGRKRWSCPVCDAGSAMRIMANSDGSPGVYLHCFKCAFNGSPAKLAEQLGVDLSKGGEARPSLERRLTETSTDVESRRSEHVASSGTRPERGTRAMSETTTSGTIQSPGRYRATMREIRIGKSKGGAVQAEIVYDTPQGTITGWHYLTRNTGERNTRQCESFVELGWDGESLIGLSDLAGEECMIKVAEEEYQGKKSMRVQFVDAPSGGTTATGAALDELQAIFSRSSGGDSPKTGTPVAVLDDSDVPF